MFRTIAIAAAPLALLAACGEAPVEQEDVALEGAGTGLTSPDIAPEDMPQVSENALDNVDYSGTYTMTGLDGSESSVTLNREDNTYTYRGADGTERTGTYRRVDSNRLLIEDFDGRAGYFSVADGAIYRLADETTPYDEITVTGMYRRENAPVQENGPDATTETVADKRS